MGQFCGHADGLVYIASKGDGRYLATNSKDQSIKLWDLRRFSDSDDVIHGLRAAAGQRWDYRLDNRYNVSRFNSFFLQVAESPQELWPELASCGWRQQRDDLHRPHRAADPDQVSRS